VWQQLFGEMGWLVCLLVSRIMQKIPMIFTKFGGKVSHGPRQMPLDFFVVMQII